MKKKATVRDVAAEAGVSIATVDRALNRRAGVRAATIDRVAAAANKLGYRQTSGADSASKSYRLRFILPAGSNAFMRGLEQAIRHAAQGPEALHTEIDLITVPPFDERALAEALNALEPDTCQGVALVATDAPMVRIAIDRLVARGVAVVTLVSDLPNSRRSHFIGIDNVAAGRTAASLLGRFLRHQPGKIQIVAGSMVLRDHAERRFGFEQVMRMEYPQLELLEIIEGRDDKDLTESLLSARLETEPGIVGIYSLGAGNRGVINSIQQHPGADAVTVIAHELTEHARTALLDGVFAAVINQDTGHEARSAIRVIKALIDGEKIYTERERIRIDIFLRDNMS
ncbi:MAG: LacI family DNA-binding transcriptional regulator [Gammaproteobacteria bacterium]